jgi:hypothetical protein
MPMKSSPNPARIAPVERVLPLAIIQRKAPKPSIGRANADIRRRNPNIATSHGVEVVPKVANNYPNGLREGDQSGTDANDGQRRRG